MTADTAVLQGLHESPLASRVRWATDLQMQGCPHIEEGVARYPSWRTYCELGTRQDRREHVVTPGTTR